MNKFLSCNSWYKKFFFNSAYSTHTITGSVFKVFNLVSLQNIGIYSFLMNTLGRVIRCFYSPKADHGNKEEKWNISYSENPVDSSSFASWSNYSCLGIVLDCFENTFNSQNGSIYLAMQDLFVTQYTVCYIKIFTLVETKKILLDLRIIVSAENILTFKKIFFLY